MTATIGKPYSKYKDYAESYHVAGTRPEDSQWRGKLAQTLGYSGSINQFAYDLASEGKNSYGRQLRKYQKNSRPAICDVTLNAPKSLSVEALVHSNPIAIAAHNRGVENAISFTEQHLLFSQVKHQGKVERVHTSKALIGSFQQRDNREGEPHLHTHNVIFNVGWVEDKWRSLANEQVYLGKLTIGAIYQNDTAYHLHQAGYKTYWDANGQFELAGNPKRLLEQTFAQRTEKIEAYLRSQGLDRSTATPEQLNAANRATRKLKAYDKDATTQVRDWQSTAVNAGIVPCQPVSQQELEFYFSSASDSNSPTEIVIAAAQRLSEKRSSFGYMELVKEGCRLSQGRYLSTQIQKAISESRELIPVTSTTNYPEYTTRTILQQESQILEKAIQNKSSYVTISDATKAEQVAKKFTLNSDQTSALQHIATSQDLITLIQGSAGVGKTRSLSALKDLMGDSPIIGCAVGGLQAEALEAESGISSQTLESLIRTPLAEFPKDTLIVVDEAGVVSNRQMHQLAERAKSSNCRILLVGDTKQLSAVEQGNPFQLLQTRAGLETASISQNMRQKDEQLLAAVNLCEALRPASAFDLLNAHGKIREIPNSEQRGEAVVDDYLTRPPEQRRNTLIMATTHKERAKLTVAIRDRLIQQGELVGPALLILVLQKKDLDKHHLLLADHYQVGDRVRFWRNCASFNKGELYLVKATNPDKHSVELVDTLGQTKILDLARYREREVFSPQQIEIAAGEEMRFTAGIKDQKGKQLQVNGQRFRVEAIDPQTQAIEISTKGKRFTVSPQELLHSDYRWISTIHSLQGATAQYAIFAAGQGNKALLSRESWYVAASRAKLEFAVYCGDKAQLRSAIQVSLAQRPAIDLIHPSISTSIQEQARQAIVDYVQQQEVEAASTPELLKTLTETLHQRASATKTTQQVNGVAVRDDRLQDTEQKREQLLLAISEYVEAQSLETALLEQNLEDLTNQLPQLQVQSASGTIQQLAPALKNDLVPAPSTVIGSEALKRNTDQLLQALTDYIEVAAIEAALTQPLTTLIEELRRLQAQGINKGQNNDQSQEAIAPTPPPPRPELLAAQFQILTDQILAPYAVYQEQGLRIERSNDQIAASIKGTQVDIRKPENLARLVNHLQALVNEFQLDSLYEEFVYAARLEKSITNQAIEVVQLNQGNYQSQGLSVKITGSCIEIQRDRELVFKSNQGQVQRIDDLSQMQNLELQLQSTIKGLNQMLKEQRQQEQARLLAERLKAESELASRRTMERPKQERGRGLAL